MKVKWCKEALRKIRVLMEFHNISDPCTDLESETEATTKQMDHFSIDDYMIKLVYEWGMDWELVEKNKVTNILKIFRHTPAKTDLVAP